MQNIEERINSFSIELDAISKQAKKYLRNDSKIDDSVLNILHRPWVAKLNWGLMLYSPAKNNWFSQFESNTKKIIPGFYKSFLQNINGGFIYGMSLYGLPTSLYTKGTLTRGRLQCHDLTTANSNWILGYDVNRDLFHFGSRTYTYDENVGYFFDGEKIMCFRKSGELTNSWNTFEEMLNEEVEILENQMLQNVPSDVQLILN
ncbi:SMI1/KNR4 family protein [Hyunsoonleella ulvae]|uniref:SMI1/KNR4 family protein n=1 Tax=Hyunsoonleella ulvae TaxID=2799948 RepID=UPI0019398459|nr:SMI1/KNR4 family protein [Hyunsoonleella ulvae]